MEHWLAGIGLHYKHVIGTPLRSRRPHRKSDFDHTKTAPVNKGTFHDLSKLAHRLEGKPYSAYYEISGAWHSKLFTFFVDYVQNDPHSAPSRVRVRVNHQHAQFPTTLSGNYVRKIALCDFLARSIHRTLQSDAIKEPAQYKKSLDAFRGYTDIDHPGQHVLQRTSVIINKEFVEARLFMLLPARDRVILGFQAARLLEADISRVGEALLHSNHDHNNLRAFINNVEDQEALRNMVSRAGLSAFVANGAVLPRSSGDNDAQIPAQNAVSFKSPPNLEQTFHLPHRGAITGMAIPTGITLIAGGDFHGKSTLVNALSNGCYNKVPGDGREFVVTSPRAVAIRGEPGRSVTNVDISPFINNLPWNKSTTSFSTTNASGSTSMAAGVIEALELGADTLLLDEDTSAPDFLARDRRMQSLISPEHDTITPLISKIRSLYRDHRCSTILVVGRSGDFFDVAGLILQMCNYVCLDVTKKAKAIARKDPSEVLQTEETKYFGNIRPRKLFLKSLIPSGGVTLVSTGKFALLGKILSNDDKSISHGGDALDLQCVPQLVHSGQTKTIVACLKLLATTNRSDSSGTSEHEQSLKEELGALGTAWNKELGLDELFEQDSFDGFLSRPRLIEVGMVINRLRAARLEYASGD